MDGWFSGSVDQWISGSVRDVCHTNQIGSILESTLIGTPIKFPVVKVNGMREDLIPIHLRTAIFFLL